MCCCVNCQLNYKIQSSKNHEHFSSIFLILEHKSTSNRLVFNNSRIIFLKIRLFWLLCLRTFKMLKSGSKIRLPSRPRHNNPRRLQESRFFSTFCCYSTRGKSEVGKTDFRKPFYSNQPYSSRNFGVFGDQIMVDRPVYRRRFLWVCTLYCASILFWN